MDKRYEVEQYIADKGWSIAATEKGGREIILAECPLCGKKTTASKRRFYINRDKGVWNSFCCARSGNLFTLKRQLDDLDVFVPSRQRDRKMSITAARIADKLKKRAENRSASKAKASKLAPVLDRAQKAIYERRGHKARKYLTRDRAFTDETIQRFGLGWAYRVGWKCSCGKYTTKRTVGKPSPGKCKHCGKQLDAKTQKTLAEYVVVPVFAKDGKTPVLLKFRTIPPAEKRFERTADCPTTLYNEHDLRGKWKSCFVCEGEMDAIAMHQMGFSPVVALTSGAQSGADLIKKHRESFQDFDEIFLCLDMDEPGEKCAAEIADVLGDFRCLRVELPRHDANECLIDGVDQSDMQEAIKGAQSYGKQMVRHIGDFASSLSSICSIRKMKGRSTGFASVDALTAGLHDGNVTLVTGDTGSGKTTFADRVTLNVAANGDAVLLASFEMTTDETVRKLVAMMGGKSVAEMSRQEREDAFAKIASKPLYILDHYGRLPFKELADSIEYGVRKYGLKLVVLDHLHFFVEQSDRFNERVMLEETLMQILYTTRKLGIHTILVVHPAKLRTDRNGKEIPPDLNDLKGSSEIKKIVSNALRVHRPRDKDRISTGLCKAVITNLKARHEQAREGSVAYRFDPDSLQYTEWTDEDTKEDKRLKKEAKNGPAKPPAKKGKSVAEQEQEQEQEEPVDRMDNSQDDDEGYWWDNM